MVETLTNSLPLLIVLSALVPAIGIFFTRADQTLLRRFINFAGNVICLGLIGLLISGVSQGIEFETRLPLIPNVDLVFHADALSLLFVGLSGFLWLVTTIYAIGYLKGDKNQSRFFGFFGLCVAATLAIALAGNLITFVIFYELLTLATYPLLVHKGDSASIRAGRIYLVYTMIGGALLLGGVVWLKAIAGPLDFTVTGILSQLQLNPAYISIIFVLLIAGLGVKAALVPLHGWLPIAMAAPAPVSALLHAVAVVKAGAFGIIRVTYDVYGIEYARDLGLLNIVAVAAAITIVYGSVRAVFQDDLKKRLAYSTVSQVSYIALGIAIAGPIATIGAMVHLVHQGLMKITLFFCAGNLAETLKVYKVSQMAGLGQRMPLTMAAFTIAALGMIGVPPIAGFVSKWYIGTGAVQVEAYWVLGVLATSSLLNAIYFLPIIHTIWFKPPTVEWPKKTTFAETRLMLLVPPLITSFCAILAGVFAGSDISPHTWSQLIAAREYGTEFVQSEQALFPQTAIGWAVVVPLLLCLLVVWKASRQIVVKLAPFAALPMLIVGLFGSYSVTASPGIFLGSLLVFDADASALLVIASLLWFIAGIYGQHYLSKDKHLARYTLCFLVCMTGNFGLILSHDLFGFVSFFTMMSLSAYGFVVHTQTQAAYRAGKTYIQWVIFGELLLFAAFVGLAMHWESAAGAIDVRQPGYVSWLLLIGFGIKAGLIPLHVWLPRAHPVAPVPASALLSGLMVKAGLIGWWRFLPIGEAALPDMGVALLTLGISGTFLAVIIGLTQKDAKTVLAYSTVSQLGVISSGVGVGLVVPQLWPALSVALLVYAIHHGVAKAALFLSVGVTSLIHGSKYGRYLFWGGVILAAMSIAGAPFTSGAVGKLGLKLAVSDITWLAIFLAVSAVSTTLLMAHFIRITMNATPKTDESPSCFNRRVSMFALMIVLVTSYTFLIPQSAEISPLIFSTKAILNALWPIVVGVVAYIVLNAFLLKVKTVPAGDITIYFERVFEGIYNFVAFVFGYISSWSKQLINGVKGYNVTLANFILSYSQGKLELHPAILFIGMMIFLAAILYPF